MFMMHTERMDFETLLQETALRFETFIIPYLNAIPSLPLKKAMTYSALSGGKYLRPALVYATGYALHAAPENMDIPASAVELIHTYSLIHDDLPSMDNADLRRGKAACHKVFGENMAILAGDALQTLAFQILAEDHPLLSASTRVAMITVLTKASGPYGMAAGQAFDISLLNQNLTDDLLLQIYQLKTGALFSTCVDLGWICSNNQDNIIREALKIFANHLGLAFQIQDDILDIEATTPILGKPQGIDLANHKFTYPALHGLQQAKTKVTSLHHQALEAITILGKQADILRTYANHLLKRHK